MYLTQPPVQSGFALPTFTVFLEVNFGNPFVPHQYLTGIITLKSTYVNITKGILLLQQQHSL